MQWLCEGEAESSGEEKVVLVEGEAEQDGVVVVCGNWCGESVLWSAGWWRMAVAGVTDGAAAWAR